MRLLITGLVASLLTVTSTRSSRAEELPLWEAGLGVAGLSVPDYRGSDQQRFYVLPLPYLVYRGNFLRLDSNGLSGLLFHSERVHLNISAEFAIPGIRPAYNAHAGYSGSLLILTVTKRFGHFWFGAFARYDELSGAVFVNSPLMRTDQSVMAGLGLAWVFAESKTLVHASP